MTLQRLVVNETGIATLVDLTPEEEAATLADWAAAEAAAAVAQIPLSLVQVACARLVVDGFDVTGLERSVGLSVAFMIDVDVAWIFFDTPQPDTEYVVTPSDGVTKYTDYMEVTKPSMSAISLIVQRVQ